MRRRPATSDGDACMRIHLKAAGHAGLNARPVTSMRSCPGSLVTGCADSCRVNQHDFSLVNPCSKRNRPSVGAECCAGEVQRGSERQRRETGHACVPVPQERLLLIAVNRHDTSATRLERRVHARVIPPAQAFSGMPSAENVVSSRPVATSQSVTTPFSALAAARDSSWLRIGCARWARDAPWRRYAAATARSRRPSRRRGYRQGPLRSCAAQSPSRPCRGSPAERPRRRGWNRLPIRGDRLLSYQSRSVRVAIDGDGAPLGHASNLEARGAVQVDPGARRCIERSRAADTIAPPSTANAAAVMSLRCSDHAVGLAGKRHAARLRSSRTAGRPLAHPAISVLTVLTEIEHQDPRRPEIQGSFRPRPVRSVMTSSPGPPAAHQCKSLLIAKTSAAGSPVAGRRQRDERTGIPPMHHP